MVKNLLRDNGLALTKKNYEATLMELCHELDIPTPVTLEYHFRCFRDFNTAKYTAGEFMESVPFTSLHLDNCPEK